MLAGLTGVFRQADADRIVRRSVRPRRWRPRPRVGVPRMRTTSKHDETADCCRAQLHADRPVGVVAAGGRGRGEIPRTHHLARRSASAGTSRMSMQLGLEQAARRLAAAIADTMRTTPARRPYRACAAAPRSSSQSGHSAAPGARPSGSFSSASAGRRITCHSAAFCASRRPARSSSCQRVMISTIRPLWASVGWRDRTGTSSRSVRGGRAVGLGLRLDRIIDDDEVGAPAGQWAPNAGREILALV